MVGTQISRHVAGSGGGQNQHGVDDEQPHPLDSQHDDHGDKHHKTGCPSAAPAPLGSGQSGIDADGVELVEEQQPEDHRRQKGDGQHAQFPIRDAEDIADQQALIVGEAASPGQDHQPQSHTAGRKNTDNGIGGGETECRMRFMARAKITANTTITAL